MNPNITLALVLLAFIGTLTAMIYPAIRDFLRSLERGHDEES